MAIEFDGTDDYIVAAGVGHNDAAFSFAGWIRVDTDGLILVHTTASGPGTDNSWAVYVRTSGVVEGFVWDGAGQYVTGTTAVAGAWHHVVLTGANSSTLNLYIDGASEGTPDSLGTIITTGDRYRIGQTSVLGNSGGYFDGQMDDVRVFNRVLTAEERYALVVGYRGPLGGEVLWLSMSDAQAVLHWDGDSLATTDVLPDMSSNGNNGTPTNTPTARASDALRFASTQWWAGFTSIISQTVSGALTPNGVLTKLISKSPTGAITPSGVTIKTVIKEVFNGSLPLSGAISKVIYKNVAGQLTPTGALIKQLLEFFIMRLDAIIATDGHIETTAENEDR